MDLRVLRKEYKLPLCILQNAVQLSQHAAMTFSDDNQNNKEVDLQQLLPLCEETSLSSFEDGCLWYSFGKKANCRR